MVLDEICGLLSVCYDMLAVDSVLLLHSMLLNFYKFLCVF